MDLFANINAKNKTKLLRLLEAHTFTFKKDLSVLALIKNDNVIGIVEKGYMQIIENDHNGNTILIEELEENSVFGTLISSLKNKDFDILTKEETQVIIIDYDHIINFPDNNKLFFNEFMRNLFEILVTKMQEKNEHIEVLSKRGIRNKLLEYFNIISKNRGTNIIYLPFTQKSLADYLAIDRSAMLRELKNLKDEGLIEIKNKRIKLLYEKNN